MIKPRRGWPLFPFAGAVLLLAAFVGLQLASRRAADVEAPSPSGSPPSTNAPPSASTSSSATPTASATPAPVPTMTWDARVALGEALYFFADDGAVAVVRRAGATGAELSVVDLQSGSERMVFRSESAISSVSLRGDTVAFADERFTGAGEVAYRVLAASWRQAAAPRVLDDFSGKWFGGGDTWNPRPLPETNGKEVVWLRWKRDATNAELVVLRADGTPSLAVSAPRAIVFALADDGRVAIATLPLIGNPGQPELLVWSGGATRMIATKTPAGGTTWSAGKIVWADDLGLVTYVRSIELVDADTGQRARVESTRGCAFLGATVQQVAFACERYDPATGARTQDDLGDARVFAHAIARPSGSGMWTVTRVP